MLPPSLQPLAVRGALADRSACTPSFTLQYRQRREGQYQHGADSAPSLREHGAVAAAGQRFPLEATGVQGGKVGAQAMRTWRVRSVSYGWGSDAYLGTPEDNAV